MTSLFLQKHTCCLVGFLALELPRSVAVMNNYIPVKLQVQPSMSLNITSESIISQFAPCPEAWFRFVSPVYHLYEGIQKVIPTTVF